MKKIIAGLSACLLSININATCIDMMNETDTANFYFKASYCDGNMTSITLKNPNEYLDNYSASLKSSDLLKLIDAYKKTLSWWDKAKEEKANIKKELPINSNLRLAFHSENDGDKITILLIGVKNRSEYGIFGIRDKERAQEIISNLENIQKNGPSKLKQLSDTFK